MMDHRDLNLMIKSFDPILTTELAKRQPHYIDYTLPSLCHSYEKAMGIGQDCSPPKPTPPTSTSPPLLHASLFLLFLSLYVLVMYVWVSYQETKMRQTLNFAEPLVMKIAHIYIYIYIYIYIHSWKKGCYSPDWCTYLAIIHILSACEV